MLEESKVFAIGRVLFADPFLSSLDGKRLQCLLISFFLSLDGRRLQCLLSPFGILP
jgi:hypothetical protein